MRYLVILAFALLAIPATGAAAQGEGNCATMTQAEAQAVLDARPTYANRALFDPDGNEIACDHGAFAGGTTANEVAVNALPTTGVGTTNALALEAAAAAVALAGAGLAIAARPRTRAAAK